MAPDDPDGSRRPQTVPDNHKQPQIIQRKGVRGLKPRPPPGSSWLFPAPPGSWLLLAPPGSSRLLLAPLLSPWPRSRPRSAFFVPGRARGRAPLLGHLGLSGSSGIIWGCLGLSGAVWGGWSYLGHLGPSGLSAAMLSWTFSGLLPDVRVPCQRLRELGLPWIIGGLIFATPVDIC